MEGSFIKMILLSLLLCFWVPGKADVSYTVSGVNEKLSNNSVWVMLQDSRGVMYFGTKEGLNVYDGLTNTIHKHNPADSLSIGNSFIRSLLEVVPSEQIWVGTGSGISIYNISTGQFSPFSASTQQGRTVTGIVNAMVLQGEKVWISEIDVGIYCYDLQTKELKLYARSSFPWALTVDHQGTLWTTAFDDGVYHYDPVVDTFNFIQLPAADYLGSSLETRSLFSDAANNCLWVGSLGKGLLRYDLQTHQWKAFQKAKDTKPLNGVYSIAQYSSSELALGTEEGLYVFNMVTHEFRLIVSLQSIFSLVKDKEGGLWAGTYYDGVHYLRPGYEAIHQYAIPEGSGRVISSIIEDPDKESLWIGARDENGGLCKYNLRTGEYKDYSSVLPYKNVRELAVFDNALWIGYYADGLARMDTRTGEIRHYTRQLNDTTSLSHNAVYSIFKSTKGVIYVGSILGLDIFDPATGHFYRIPEVRDTRVHKIVEDNMGLIWVATYQQGLYCYNPANNEWKSFRHSDEPGSLPSDCLISLHVDRKNRLYVGTEGAGLCEYHDDTRTFEPVVDDENLLHGIVCGILSDRQGHLWVSQSRSLSCIDLETKKVRVLDEGMGLKGNFYCYNGCYEDQNGMIYFGHSDGYISLISDNFPVNNKPPYLMITAVRNGQTVLSNPIKTPIVIGPHIPSIRFDFVALSYISPTQNQYAYYVAGLEEPWSHTGTEPSAIYMHLKPGKYVFHVKGANSDGVWNEDSLSVPFRVKAVLWGRTYMIALYVILLMLAFQVTLVLSRRVQKRKMDSEILQYQMEKDKELYSRQVNFFTNIIHEIRTPLSLIKAPLESIIHTLPPNAESRENYDIMARNVERLHTLADQILDFRKIEQDVYVYNFKPFDLAKIIQSVAFRYKSSCRLNNVNLTVNVPEESVVCMVDSEAVTKIMSNLLSNALKHAKSTLTVTLSKGSKGAEVRVFNDGGHIPTEALDKIFQPFYQVQEDASFPRNEGTGIGLALVKQLVDKHRGLIEVDSILNATTFTLTLPYATGTAYQEPKPLQKDLLDYQEDPEEQDVINEDQNKQFSSTLLIVEDNHELLNFLHTNFGHMYNVVTAKNGKEALDCLEENAIIDVIITDILMPVMDGVELCRQVRNNPMFCHIPIILLTAQTDIRAKTQGLDYGADVFIEKPFSLEFLKAQVASIIKNRNQIKEVFSSSPLTAPQSIARNTSDIKFLTKINEVIMGNLDNPTSLIETLALSMSISRSSLHKKIKAISGMTPNDYIQLIRLKRAAELLSTGEYQINEISYIVGFNTPSYFSKCFFNQFGMLPRDFAAKTEDKTKTKTNENQV